MPVNLTIHEPLYSNEVQFKNSQIFKLHHQRIVNVAKYNLSLFMSAQYRLLYSRMHK